MPKTLNFNKMQKPSLRIELADEKHTTIFVMPPTKGRSNRNVRKTDVTQHRKDTDNG